MKKIALATIILVACISLIGCNKSSTPNNQNSNNSKITMEQAQEIALKHAKLTSDQVSFIKTDTELENGIEVYNIEFSYENKEYDYKINSANGEIVEYDSDIEDYDITQQQATKENKSVTPNNQNSNNSKITVEKAKEISLKHANLKDNQVVFDKTEMDYDNGVQVYDIEFHYNNIEYNYEIDANTGNILSYSQD
ncbi:MAG: PepSY domain-containing protein [Clostridiales bacterium]|uniref:PepSY domain-containing protein n=1 Tax=Terrisporobacter sp. TaxID=1965305 RepID=UPI002A52B536|nr:PepSY domain-containing protein [Terrisporobacter sp.]MCI6459180.1 PepSY domain-containing protein [Clostridium sp.]MDD7755466.1 PepSY domain-containing protein [Clostridiales bacterium]MDY4136839.1 PepSY domain-containing protein [Terrisporobacter sp.]MDY4737303.1 PepSY domain-containing protein [Terrisporobacter sp.]